MPHVSVIARQVLAVLAATTAAVLVYVVGHHLLGIEVEEAAVDPARITLGTVLGTSAVAAALGWALLSGLEAWLANGRTVWVRTAVAVTLLSLLGPLTVPDLTTAGRALLALLHLVVGAVTITVLVAGPVQPRASRAATRRGPAVSR